MPVQRKVFRIEENPRAMSRRATPSVRAQPAPPTDEYLAELKALRALIEPRLPANRDAMERARAQLAEADSYRRELAALHAAIEHSRAATAALDGAAPDQPPLERAGRELDAIVAGAERATQTILRAAESIDEAVNALRSVGDAADRDRLAGDIRDRVAQIYEACNFQDLTGQRADNVLAALRSVAAQVARLMQIWRGIEPFQPVAFDEPGPDDCHLLNGPKLAGDRDHVSQDDIDAMFGCA